MTPGESSEVPGGPAYLAPTALPDVSAESAREALSTLGSDPWRAIDPLRALGRVAAAWTVTRPEAPSTCALSLAWVAAVDRHCGHGRLAWRALARARVVGDDLSAHGLQVALQAAGLGRQLGWRPGPRRALIWAGLAHDAGWTLMPAGEPQPGAHAHAGVSLLRLSGPLAPPTRLIIDAHHEHVDGGGGPLGLDEAGIPLGAQALAVLDEADSVVRAGQASSPAAVAQHLSSQAGRRLARPLVWAWLALMSRRDDPWAA